MTTPASAFDDLDGIRQHDIMEAVREGRAVEDPDLAPVAVGWARRQQRALLGFAAFIVSAVTAVGAGVWLWGDEASRAAFLATAVFGVGLLGGPMIATFYYRARRAEQATLRSHEVVAAREAPSLGERVAAGLLALFTGQLAAWAVSAAVFVLLRLGGQTAHDAAWYWNIPAVVTWVAVVIVTYRRLTDRS
jgi:hypothetical protein